MTVDMILNCNRGLILCDKGGRTGIKTPVRKTLKSMQKHRM